MKRLVFLAIVSLWLVGLVSVIGYVVGGETLGTSPTFQPVAVPTSLPAPPPTIALAADATPTPVPVPTVTPMPPPTPLPTLTPGPIPVPTLIPAPAPAAQSMEGVSVHHGEQPPYVRNECSPCGPEDDIRLVDNVDAVDPTWQQLEAFLLADDSDKNPYVVGVYVCGSFAEDLHNNAEAAGIKAAWVALDFEDDSVGHALNIFDTVDRGLVYIDTTGGRPASDPGAVKADSWDKVAYLVMGKEYGMVSLEVAAGLDYAYYEEWVQRKLDFETALHDYNESVKAHNSAVMEYQEWIAGKTFITGTEETERMQEWYQEMKDEEDRLDALSDAIDVERNSLGTFWEPMGVVSSVGVFW